MMLILAAALAINLAGGQVAPVRVGGDIRPPTRLRDVKPQYPQAAQLARVQGVVIIEATIGPSGSVDDARILRSIPLLDEAALEAVRQWQFAPTLLNGMPVPIIMTVTVNFTLTDPELLPRNCVEEPSLKSAQGAAPTSIRFTNESDAPKKVYWLDYAGRRVPYQTLAPHTTYEQPTSIGHPWVVTSEQDACWGIYLPIQQPAVSAILR